MGCYISQIRFKAVSKGLIGATVKVQYLKRKWDRGNI